MPACRRRCEEKLLASDLHGDNANFWHRRQEARVLQSAVARWHSAPSARNRDRIAEWLWQELRHCVAVIRMNRVSFCPRAPQALSGPSGLRFFRDRRLGRGCGCHEVHVIGLQASEAAFEAPKEASPRAIGIFVASQTSLRRVAMTCRHGSRSCRRHMRKRCRGM